MRKLNLSLTQLHSEFGGISIQDSNKIKGGTWWQDFYNSHAAGSYTGADVDAWGQATYGGYCVDPKDWWEGQGSLTNPFHLQEVVVYGGVGGGGSNTGGIVLGSTSTGWDYFSNWYGQMNSDQFGTGYYSSTTGTSGNSANVAALPWLAAITTMISSVDLSVSSAEGAAAAMKVNLPLWFQTTGKGFALVGVASNIAEMVEHGFNATDFNQAAIGTILVVFSSTLGAPVVLVVGVGLFAWELWETQQPPSGGGSGGSGGYGG